MKNPCQSQRLICIADSAGAGTSRPLSGIDWSAPAISRGTSCFGQPIAEGPSPWYFAWACRRSHASCWRPVRKRPSRRRPLSQRRTSPDPRSASVRATSGWTSIPRATASPCRISNALTSSCSRMACRRKSSSSSGSPCRPRPTASRVATRTRWPSRASRPRIPRRRVFVVFLDTGMTTIEGSHAARRPIVDMLDRLIGDDDLFAVMTPDMGAKGITFARRTESLDAELAKYWTWGQRDALVRRDPEEIALETCFPDPAPEKYCTGPDRRTRQAAAGRLPRRRGAAHRAALRAACALGARRSRVRAGRPARGAQGRDRRVAGLAAARAQAGPGPAAGMRSSAIARDARREPGRPHRERRRRRTGRHGDGLERAVPRAWPCNTPAPTTRISFASSSSAPIASTCRSIPSTLVDSRIFDRSIGARDDRIRGDPGERSERGRSTPGPLGR